ncbi:MAG: hypothetical protein ACI3WU_05265 [Phascolarctobacterium sp.]
MPTPVQSAKVMIFNRKNGTGKHYTKAELDARTAAAAKMTRKTVKLKIPPFLKTKACEAAYKIWKEIVKEGLEIDLFDNVDSRILADFCRYQALLEEELERTFPNQKVIDKLGKTTLAYAEKLGLTPTARARLAVKQAAKAQDGAENELDAMMA